MIPPYPFRIIYEKEILEPENGEAPKSRKPKPINRLSLLLGGEAPPLCQVCRRRDIYFRPLVKDPPSLPHGFTDDTVEDDDLVDLEMKNAVYVEGFLLEEARAAQSQCSLCRVLVSALGAIWKDGWLLNMRCVCILRSRYDWRAGRDRENWKIIHLYQIFVEFQPIEEEIVFDVLYTSKFKGARKGRLAIPAAINSRVLRDWFQQCDEKHSHPAIPLTVISRMQAITSRGLFRVINTSTGSVETPTSLPKYAALSYVWGADVNKTDYRPLESRPISAYAPTIRDAATIASAVGYGWIWVDRICIDQDSDSEKAILIPYMKDIFAAAQITIVAGCGDGANSGLVGSPETPRKAEKPLTLGSSVSILPVAQRLHELLDDSIWSSRGWTFEEYVFSRRLLFILGSEVFLDCGTHTFRESSGRRSVGMIQDVNKPADMAQAIELNYFLSALKEYTGRQLKFERDRVAAFAGVVIAAAASAMDEASERELVKHGHPLRFFEVLLTWQYLNEYNSGEEFGKALQLLNEFVPSWSWASSPEQIAFETIRNRLILDWDFPWFNYTVLQNHDILGLPTGYNSTSHMTGLAMPAELITDAPWMKSLPVGSPLVPEAGPSTGSRVLDPPSLTNIHIVTLVFDARFVHWKSGFKLYFYKHNYILVPLESTETSEEVRQRTHLDFERFDHWSLPRHLESRFRPDGVGSRPQPFETFAMITGRQYHLQFRGSQEPPEVCYDLYVMLLNPTEQHGTYRRMGTTRLVAVKEESYFVDVIKKGRPRWEYIRLV
ncbi:heterokaryon incompatibility protein-domain-containing protein [Xylaria palmicola]|nr:heterokaryon incompatibility protein-domain-containing protein [Xylaria palmicola]